MTLTTFDENLCKIIEPHVSTTKERFEALKVLRDNSIPSVVWLCPILPFINDTTENLLGILNYCKEAKVKGIIWFGAGLTLREGNREYFYSQLDRFFPTIKGKYISTYGLNYSIASKQNSILNKMFLDFCKSNNIMSNVNEIFTYLMEYPKLKTLFD
jgi:DNA repair photolyase